ncbi:hypothetical protein SAMN05443572_111299 [Myxococcus fulvus]|uniref:Lipoprotein n=1 Tax=Myxococcus fulvus TaxID=33 RepID=A0A511TCZ0_MYXFU|nr:hypothetical protein [Myxococcus fulvus]AKF85508.1 hypothetical protein MFUL124B02_13265 [Myxococcus fulvus 124B02]GEN12034.1 hypothetical protein MFU01_70710 [Myxococcus fulvus]SEU36755.1 hypothetical protein SAMN05443572_111299 [Myxococcus fulvus]
MRISTPSTSYRAAIGLALFAVSCLVWLSLGVGIIGSDGARVNLLYGGVVLIGVAGAFIARLRAAGMARTLVAMAVTQAVIGLVAVLAGWGLPWSPPAEVLGLTAGFVSLFLGAAWLFQRGAGGRAVAS